MAKSVDDRGRGARPARRDEGAYCWYVTEEERSRRGCIDRETDRLSHSRALKLEAELHLPKLVEFVLVAPAGLEPARSCEQGILSRTAGDLTNHEREIIAQDDTRSDTDAHECPPRVDDPASESDPVELALATALDRASAAGQWTVAEVLARELEARAGVVQLDAERRRRDR
jgi:hypothetical protein